MPARSKAQYRFMQMMAHNPEMARKKGSISSEKAKEYISKNKGKNRFSRLKEKLGKK